jgi:hypothetical protein
MPSAAAAIARFTALCLLLVSSLKAQPPRFHQFEYIDKYANEALHQMASYRIPASVILAQAIFESSSGQSELARRSNNHFGIKCHSQWVGDTVVKHDDALNECFRKYENISDSYTDHSLFIATRRWYAPLFKLSITDYKGWCRGLKQAGYATFPGYAEELIRIIEQLRLHELDGVVKLDRRLVSERTHEIIECEKRAEFFTLKDFSKNGLIFLDEKEVYLRSLEMIFETPEELDGLIVSEK